MQYIYKIHLKNNSDIFVCIDPFISYFRSVDLSLLSYKAFNLQYRYCIVSRLFPLYNYRVVCVFLFGRILVFVFGRILVFVFGRILVFLFGRILVFLFGRILVFLFGRILVFISSIYTTVLTN